MWLTLYIYSVVVYMNRIDHFSWVSYCTQVVWWPGSCVIQSEGVGRNDLWQLGHSFLQPRSLYSVLPRAGGVTPNGYQSGQHASVCHLLSGGQPRTEVALWTSLFSLFLYLLCCPDVLLHICLGEWCSRTSLCLVAVLSIIIISSFESVLSLQNFLCSILTHDWSWSKEWRHLLIFQMWHLPKCFCALLYIA